ncbi:MAG: hypothetical protein JWN41_1535 [Thermoleophilia bacterium]|nr:hypothetical protein [Thermoleophilia bacterium]
MHILSPRRIAASTLTLFLLTAIAAFAPAAASANIIVGFESNGEFANPDRTPDQQAVSLDKVVAEGATLIRVNVSWADIANGCKGQTLPSLTDNTNACYNWAVYDSLVKLAQERGIKLLFSVTKAPDWLQPVKPSLTAEQKPYYIGTTPAQFTRTLQFYPAFITAIATRYNASSSIGNVSLWTIWSEPNSKTFWLPQVGATAKSAPLRYAQLYALSAKALKAANPSATVAPGPTGPNSTPNKPIPYIKAFQKAVTPLLPGMTITAKRRYLGAWAHNPYPVNYSPALGSPKLKGHAFLSPDSLGMPDTKALLALLDSAPITRGLKVWATEFGWQTTMGSTDSISTALQARYIPEAFDWLDRTGRFTIGISYVLTDPANFLDFQSGTYTAAGKPKPSFFAFQRMISTDATSVKRGGYVNIWAKANVKPTKTAVQYSVNGFSGWKTFIAPRRADGSVRIKLRMMRTLYFATYDGATRGPKRAVIVKS